MTTPAAFFYPDEEWTEFPVGLDDVTVARLMELCDAAKVPPAAMIAAIVRDVLEDDAQQHDPDEQPDIVRRTANRDLN